MWAYLECVCVCAASARAGQDATELGPEVRDASPARAAPLPEAEASTEATAVATEATVVAEAATLAELSPLRPSLAPPASGGPATEPATAPGNSKVMTTNANNTATQPLEHHLNRCELCTFQATL